jgi:hypothetical protein
MLHTMPHGASSGVTAFTSLYKNPEDIFDDAVAMEAAGRRISLASNPESPKKKKQKSFIRRQERFKKRKVRVSEQLIKRAYVRPPSQVRDPSDSFTNSRCCRKNCCEAYHATPCMGALTLPSARTNLVTTLGAMTMAGRRQFVQSRIRYNHNVSVGIFSPGDHVKQFYIESADFLANHGNKLTIVPAGALVSVCARAFTHLTGVSNNLIYQPAVPTPMFNVDVAGGQSVRTDKVPRRADDATRWLNFMGAFYMQDPVDNCIYLPFASRDVMYELYSQDHQEFWQDRDDRDNGEHTPDREELVDLEYIVFIDRQPLTYGSFLKVWRQVCPYYDYLFCIHCCSCSEL